MSLETKLAKGAKKSMAREKEKEKHSGESHVIIKKHKGGYTTEAHDHSSREMCPDGKCGETEIHSSYGKAQRMMKKHFGEDAEKMGEKDEDEGEIES